MRVAVIGLGQMGAAHIRQYRRLQGVTLCGGMDVEAAARAKARRELGVPTFNDLNALLDQRPDAVSVCAPTSQHLQTGLAVLRRGIPLLMEKPLAPTVAEGRELLQAAARFGAPLMVGHVERFNPAVRRLGELLDGEAILSIQAERVGPFPARVQDVGVLRDLASHDLDLAVHLTGARFSHLHAIASSPLPGQNGHEGAVCIAARLDNGALASFTANWLCPYTARRLRVTTASRELEANLATPKVTEYRVGTGPPGDYTVCEHHLPARDALRDELAAFLQAAQAGMAMPVTGEAGLYVLEVIEGV